MLWPPPKNSSTIDDSSIISLLGEFGVAWRIPCSGGWLIGRDFVVCLSYAANSYYDLTGHVLLLKKKVPAEVYCKVRLEAEMRGENSDNTGVVHTKMTWRKWIRWKSDLSTK